MIKQVTDNTYENELKNTTKDKIILDFYADWCGPCKVVSEILNLLDNQNNDHESNFMIMKIDVDASPELTTSYNVEALATLVFLNKDREIIGKEVGLVKEEIIKNYLNG